MGGGGFPAGNSFGDYDHCINALRMLQRKATINLIYDPKKAKKPLE